MSCFFGPADCDPTPRANCTRWGVLPPGRTICTKHFDELCADMASRATGLEQPYVEDYARIYMLFENPDGCLLRLQALNHEATRAVAKFTVTGTEPDPNYLRLSAILQTYEDKCWFQRDLVLPLGILTADEFKSLVRRGYHLKDYGAGVKHGEFTHRLQWHVIMRAMTDGFTIADPRHLGWNHTPLDLFCTLGKPTVRLWSFLLDNSGDGDKRSLRHPDWFHERLLSSGGVALIQGFITKREVKRREEFVRLIQQYVADNQDDFVHPDQPTMNIATHFMGATVTSHQSFKRFEIDIVRSLKAARPKDYADVYHSFDKPAKAVYADKKATPSAKPGRFRPAYTEVVSGVYKITPGPLASESDADALVQASLGKFRS